MEDLAVRGTSCLTRQVHGTSPCAGASAYDMDVSAMEVGGSYGEFHTLSNDPATPQHEPFNIPTHGNIE